MRFIPLLLISAALVMIGLQPGGEPSIEYTYMSRVHDKPTPLDSPLVYILKKVAEDADFDYVKLDSIDKHIASVGSGYPEDVMPVFEPVEGQYRFYQFLATCTGHGIYDAETWPVLKTYHDILIIKTDSTNKIIDAYQYTLEWAEPPDQYDVFKSSANGAVLHNNMNINALAFRRTYGWDTADYNLKQEAVIKVEARGFRLR